MKVALLQASIPWAEGPFSQRLDPQTATWTLSAGGRTVATAFVDANSDTLVLKTAQAVAPSLQPLRVDAASGVGAVTPPFSCQPYYVSADVSRTASAKVQTVFHRNANCSGANDYMTTTLAGENIPKDETMRDPLHLRATGAAAATSADSKTVAVAVITDDTGTSTENGVLAALEKRAAAALEAAEKPAMLAAHEAWWAAKWGSHFIHVTTKADQNKDGARLSSMYCLQRYTQLLQARSPFPIKFNGMLFTSNRPPLADHRDWGGLNWWQNLRLPYYNMLQAGDHDEIATLFEQFNRTLPVVAARTKAYFGFTGFWWPEYTHPLYGTTHPASYGCNRAGGGGGAAAGPIWHSEDRWNGYNRQGSLDLSLMILDHYAHTGQSGYLGIPVK